MKKVVVLILIFCVVFLNLFSCDNSENINNTDLNTDVDENDEIIHVPPQVANFFSFIMETSKVEYSMDETLEITVKMIENVYAIEGELYIQMEESEYFEIIGDKEIIINDFGSGKYCSFAQPLEVKFNIKAIKETCCLESFSFKIKFNIHEDTIMYEQNVVNATETLDWSEDYFLTIYKLRYYFSSNKVFLFSDRMEYFKTKDNLGYEYTAVANKGLYDFINNLYEKGYITEDKAMNMLLHCNSIKHYDVLFEVYENEVLYISKNMRLRVKFSSENEVVKELYELAMTWNSENNLLILSKLLNFLCQEKFITDEQFILENNVITQGKIRQVSSYPHFFNELLLFDGYKYYAKIIEI